MSFKDFAIAVAGPEAERVAAGRKQARTMEALGTYLGQGADPGLADIYKQSPQAGLQAEQQTQERRQQIANAVRYLDSVPEDKRAMAYQGLVPQLQRAFPGQQIPPTWGPDVENALVQVRAMTAGGQQNALPAQAQSFEAMAAAAGLQRGTPEYQRAAQIHLGMEGRASGAAIAYKTVKGRDGRERLVAVDPRTPGAMLIDESTPGFGGGQPQQQPAPQPTRAQSGSPNMDALAQTANQMIAAGIPPEQVDAFLMQAAQGAQGVQVNPPTMQPAAIQQPAPAAPQGDISRIPINSYGGGPVASPFVGRSPEEDEAAKTRARLQAEEQYRPPPEGMRWNADRTGYEPIAGGKQDREDLDRQASSQARRRLMEGKTPAMLRDIQRGISLASAAGPIAGAWADPGENAGFMRRAGAAALTPKTFELAQHLESVKSNISIDQLQQMRESSPTGGALGAIPVKQQEYLMSLLGTLRADLRGDLLEENLKDLYNTYLESMAYAVYGDEEDHAIAIRRGDMTPEQSAQFLAEKNNMLREQMESSPFTKFGRKGQGGARQPESNPDDDLIRKYL